MAVPAEIVVRQVGIVFKRHFQSIGKAVEMIADPVGRQSHVCLTRRIFVIAVIVLEIGAGIEQREFELVF